MLDANCEDDATFVAVCCCCRAAADGVVLVGAMRSTLRGAALLPAAATLLRF